MAILLKFWRKPPMTKISEFEFDKYPFTIKKEATSWELTLKQSEVLVHDEKDLAILTLTNRQFLPASFHWEEDSVTFTYQVAQDYLDIEGVKGQERGQKLRALINLGEVNELLALPVSFFIHPENVLFDSNLMPKLAYRGLSDKMPPKATTEEGLLRQYKCFILALMEEKKTFTELYDGNLDTYRGSKFAKAVLEATNFEQLIDYLNVVYQQEVTDDKNRMRKVSKRQYRIYQQLSIWFGILAVVLAIPVGYFLFFREPFQAKVLSADTAFLKNDYEAVISTLEPIDTQSVPYSQKYTLAYSFVQGKDFSDKQKTIILNNISLKSDEEYLGYWIENGRGNLDEALDIAKKLEDSDLILYGLMQKIEQVRNDSNLSGSEREEQIDKFESDYKKYDEKREKSLNPEEKATEGQTDDTTETSGGN